MSLFDLFSDDFNSKSSIYEDRESYYIQFIESTEFEYYLSFFQPKEKDRNVNTDQRIKLFDIDFNSGIEIITQNLGVPRLKVSYKKNGFNTTVLFYKKQFYSHKAILQFHLLNNSLIYGCLTIPHHDKKITATFNKLLSVKYSDAISTDFENSIISDADNNKILYRNYFFPSLIYVGSNVSLIAPAQKDIDEKESFRIQKHSSEWYERL